MSATWTYEDTNDKMYDSNGNNVTKLQKNSGKLLNSKGDELVIDATSGKFSSNGSNAYQTNNGTVLTFPVVAGALTVSDIELDGMEDVTVQSKGSKIYEITGYVKKNAENVALTIGINTYLYSMQIDSSTSVATTSAAFSADKLSEFETGKTISAEWSYDNTI